MYKFIYRNFYKHKMFIKIIITCLRKKNNILQKIKGYLRVNLLFL